MVRPEHVYAHDLNSSSFYNNPAMGVVATMLGRDGGNLQSLLAEIGGSGLELVPFPKHNGSRRPGAHLHPVDAMVAARTVCEAVDPLRIVQECTNPAQRVAFAHEVRSDLRQVPSKGVFRRDGWERMTAALSAAHEGGSKVGATLDVAKFYEQIKPDTAKEALVELKVPTATIDLTCHMIDANKVGAPQGYTASDVIGYAVLVPVYRKIAHYGIQAKAYCDDFRLHGRSTLDVARDSAVVAELLEEAGLSYRAEKQRVLTGHEAAFLLKLGVDVRAVKIGDFVRDERGLEAAPAAGEGYWLEGCRKMPRGFSAQWFDVRSLYDSEFAPGQPARSEQLFRWCIRNMREVHREVLLDDLQELITDPGRAWSVGVLLRVVEPTELAQEIAEHCVEVSSRDPALASEMLRCSASWNLCKEAPSAAYRILAR